MKVEKKQARYFQHELAFAPIKKGTLPQGNIRPIAANLSPMGGKSVFGKQQAGGPRRSVVVEQDPKGGVFQKAANHMDGNIVKKSRLAPRVVAGSRRVCRYSWNEKRRFGAILSLGEKTRVYRCRPKDTGGGKKGKRAG